MQLPDKLFKILIHIVDLNGNGTVEYDEFCFMMFTVAKRFHIWKTISRFNQKLIYDETGETVKVRLTFAEIWYVHYQMTYLRCYFTTYPPSAATEYRICSLLVTWILTRPSQ
jgi:hypothetical protein